MKNVLSVISLEVLCEICQKLRILLHKIKQKSPVSGL